MILIELISSRLSFPSSDSIPSNFWEIAASLGELVQSYTRNLLHDTTTSYPAVAEQIDKMKANTKDLVDSVAQFRNVAMPHTNSSLDSISDELGNSFDSILKLLQEEFPPPEQAPNHEERALMASKVLMAVEEKMIDVLSKYDVNEDHVRSTLGELRPTIQNLVVVTGRRSFIFSNSHGQFHNQRLGDIVELYPGLLDLLFFSISILVIPEGWLLRPLLSLIGFGPYGPIKGMYLSPLFWWS